MKGIVIKSPSEIGVMRQAGRIVALTLGILAREVRSGMRTAELDDIAQREIERQGAKASFKGYRGFPASVCVSVNEEIVHGIPGERVFEEGDIVSLDLGVLHCRIHGDSTVTVGVGRISPEATRLIETTRGALDAGIDAARDGAYLGDKPVGCH